MDEIQNAPKIFIGFKDPLGFYKNIKEVYITEEKKTKEKQREFKSDLNEILKGRYKSENQNIVIKNIKTLYESRENLSNCLMIFLELYLKLNTKQNLERGSKY